MHACTQLLIYTSQLSSSPYLIRYTVTPVDAPANFTDKPTSILEWENWRYAAEMKWREELRMKEIKLREAIEEEVREEMKSRSEEIRRAYEESAKMEIRLKSALDNVERQKARLLHSEEQVGQRLAQKTAELQLLQRRVRDEAKSKIEVEQRKADVLAKQLHQAQQTIDRMHRRIADTEKDFDEYRQAVRGTPEQVLREQVASLKGTIYM